MHTIGYNVQSLTSGDSNTIVIGYNTTALGGSGTTTIFGDGTVAVNAGTGTFIQHRQPATGNQAYWLSTGELVELTSSKRFKTDIQKYTA